MRRCRNRTTWKMMSSIDGPAIVGNLPGQEIFTERRPLQDRL